MAQEIFEYYEKYEKCRLLANNKWFFDMPPTFSERHIDRVQVKYLVRLNKPTMRSKLVLSSEILASGWELDRIIINTIWKTCKKPTHVHTDTFVAKHANKIFIC